MSNPIAYDITYTKRAIHSLHIRIRYRTKLQRTLTTISQHTSPYVLEMSLVCTLSLEEALLLTTASYELAGRRCSRSLRKNAAAGANA